MLEKVEKEYISEIDRKQIIIIFVLLVKGLCITIPYEEDQTKRAGDFL